MGKSTINGHFNSYVSLPEGRSFRSHVSCDEAFPVPIPCWSPCVHRGTSRVTTGIPDHPCSTVTRRPRVFSNVTMENVPTLRLYKWWSHLKRPPFSGISRLTMFDYRYKHRWILPSGTGVSLLAGKSSQWWSVLLTFTNWSNPPNIHPIFIPHIHHIPPCFLEGCLMWMGQGTHFINYISHVTWPFSKALLHAFWGVFIHHRFVEP